MSAVLEQPSGLFYDLDIDEYHAGPGISNSGLANIARSPWHYYSRHLDPKRPEPKEKQGQREGHLAHTAILEPDKVNERYVIGPNLNRNNKGWKDFVAAHPDRIAVKGEEYEIACLQRDAVWALPDVAKALGSGHREVSAYWNDPETGVLCRARPDFVHEAPAGVVLLDVKTCGDASPGDFARHIARKGYHRQGVFYTDGYEHASGQKVLAFIFVAIESEWPYAACAVMLDDESSAAGRALYRRNLNRYAECLEAGRWPSYSESIELVSLPRYAMENYDV